jgi:hypothetical protein
MEALRGNRRTRKFDRMVIGRDNLRHGDIDGVTSEYIPQKQNIRNCIGMNCFKIGLVGALRSIAIFSYP